MGLLKRKCCFHHERPPLGLNVEGFWYNKDLFEQAGVEVPTTWDEFDAVLEKLDAAGIQPMSTGGSDKWLATRLINAYAVRTMGNDVMTRRDPVYRRRSGSGS